MKKFFLLIVLLSNSFCSKKHELIGTWKVKSYDFLDLGIGYLHGASGYLLSTEIYLSADSTYKEKTVAADV